MTLQRGFLWEKYLDSIRVIVILIGEMSPEFYGDQGFTSPHSYRVGGTPWGLTPLSHQSVPGEKKYLDTIYTIVILFPEMSQGGNGIKGSHSQTVIWDGVLHPLETVPSWEKISGH